MVQLSHAYMTTGEAKALTVQTIAGKVVSVLLHTLSSWLWLFPHGAGIFQSHGCSRCAW